MSAEETERLIDKIEALEDENERLRKRVRELEKLCEPVNPGQHFTEE
jgi:ubiquinone biosynthesis protein UbiJ